MHLNQTPEPDEWTLDPPARPRTRPAYRPLHGRPRWQQVVAKWLIVILLGVIVGASIGAGIFTILYAFGLR
jgi:hypothetical protein